MQAIAEWHEVDAALFHTRIRPLARPAVLRGLAAQWPAVQAAAEGPAALCALLRDAATAEPIDYVSAPAAIGGRLHYREDMRGHNFTRAQTSLPAFLAMLQANAASAAPVTLAVQGLRMDRHCPALAASHSLPLLPPGTTGRLWLGSAAKVATHADPSENLACVVAGTRRFTLFPPDQLANLYMGPFTNTPGGTPVSMVHVTAPDLVRYPRFAEALDHALTADLAPGDALYIPYLWFHHVEALAPINLLANFWWNEARADLPSPWDAMLHGMMSLRALPADQRAAWKAMFDHYVFLCQGDPGAHIAPHARGVIGAEEPEDIARMRQVLLRHLAESAS